MPDNAAARRAMVDSQLRPQGVTDRALLAAMGSVPREQFVPENARSFAYFDRSIAVEGGAMMAPTPLARLLDAAAPRLGERGLVVSSAPAYVAALLRAMGLETVEQSAAGLDAATLSGPFDLIVVEGALADIPASLSDALATRGRLVTALIAEGGVTRLAIGRKSDGIIGLVSFADCEVAPLAGQTRPAAFAF